MVAATLSAVSPLACRGGSAYPLRDAAVESPAETGSVMVSSDFDRCPSAILQVTPTTVTVGEAIAVSARPMVPGGAADGGAGALSVAWTAGSGGFADASAVGTTFTCAEAGPVTITVSVSDGVCATSVSAAVYCLGRLDGGAGGGSGGNGAGGNGMGGAGGMTPNTCPEAEPTHGGALCPTCAGDNCSLGPAGTDGCCGLSSMVDQSLCQAVVACFAANAATCTSMGDATNCFCGTSGNSCFATPGAANGPCVGPVAAAAKSPNPTMIQGQFTSPASPLGRAVNLVTCWSSFCSAECSIP